MENEVKATGPASRRPKQPKPKEVTDWQIVLKSIEKIWVQVEPLNLVPFF
jgi:hypothetical protein